MIVSLQGTHLLERHWFLVVPAIKDIAAISVRYSVYVSFPLRSNTTNALLFSTNDDTRNAHAPRLTEPLFIVFGSSPVDSRHLFNPHSGKS
jgi:hypothetical protein